MAKANGLAKLAKPLLVATPTTKNTVTGFTPGQMVTKKKETGLMERKTENTFSHPTKASLIATSMRMAKMSENSTPKANTSQKSETANK